MKPKKKLIGSGYMLMRPAWLDSFGYVYHHTDPEPSPTAQNKTKLYKSNNNKI